MPREKPGQTTRDDENGQTLTYRIGWGVHRMGKRDVALIHLNTIPCMERKVERNLAR